MRMVVPCRFGSVQSGYRRELLDSYWTSNAGDVSKDNSWIELKREPDNDVDPNAIQVWVKGEHYGQLGYIGRQYCESVMAIIEHVIRVYPVYGDENNYEVHLVIEFDYASAKKNRVIYKGYVRYLKDYSTKEHRIGIKRYNDEGKRVPLMCVISTKDKDTAIEQMQVLVDNMNDLITAMQAPQ